MVEVGKDFGKLLTDLLGVLVCEVKGVAGELHATISGAAALDRERAVVSCEVFRSDIFEKRAW